MSEDVKQQIEELKLNTSELLKQGKFAEALLHAKKRSIIGDKGIKGTDTFFKPLLDGIAGL